MDPDDVHIPWKLWRGNLTGKGGFKILDRIKVANQLTLRQGDYSELPGWVWCNLKDFLKTGKAEKKVRTMQCENCPHPW